MNKKKLRLVLVVIIVCIITSIIYNKNNKTPISNIIIDNKEFKVEQIKEGILKFNYNLNDYGVVLIQNISKEKSKLYKYILTEDTEIISLTDGAGTYKITLHDIKISGNSTTVIKKTYDDIEVNLDKKFSRQVFLESTSLVDFESNKEIIDKVFGDTNDIDEIYFYFSNIEYNQELANKIQSGEVERYKVNISKTIENKVGICYDIASSMAAVLRYKGYETQLVYGNVGNVYHSWIRVFIDNEWIDYDPTTKRTSLDSNLSSYIIDEYH